MRNALPFEEALSQRLPLPLAQLYRRAHNAKSVQELHHAAYYLWEAALKLLGSTAVVSLLHTGRTPDAHLAELLQTLARPAVGHWWALVRALTLELADSDPHFARLKEQLLVRARDDLPRMAGLDAALLEVPSVAFSPHGKQIASGSDDKTVKVWDARTGTETLTLKGHTRSINSVAFSPDGKLLASGSGDHMLKVWSLATIKKSRTQQGKIPPGD